TNIGPPGNSPRREGSSIRGVLSHPALGHSPSIPHRPTSPSPRPQVLRRPQMRRGGALSAGVVEQTIMRRERFAMLIKKPEDIRSSEITPKWVYVNRRKFLAGALGITAGALAGEVLNNFGWAAPKGLAGGQM